MALTNCCIDDLINQSKNISCIRIVLYQRLNNLHVQFDLPPENVECAEAKIIVLAIVFSLAKSTISGLYLTYLRSTWVMACWLSNEVFSSFNLVKYVIIYSSTMTWGLVSSNSDN